VGQVSRVLRRRHRQVVVQRDVVHLEIPSRRFNPLLVAAAAAG
jgi:hypothetical protein